MLIKRSLDIIISFFALLISFPFILIVAILMQLESHGSPLFKQVRIGKGGKPFRIYKIRTMHFDKKAEHNPDFSKDKDRLTNIGKLVRRIKLDEVLQFYNVLKGEMTLVGPRPTIAKQIEEYTEHQRQRLKAKPGITGLAQINGNTSIPWETRIEYDIYYINNWSLKLDLYIILKTFLVVILGEDKFKKDDIIFPGQSDTIDM